MHRSTLLLFVIICLTSAISADISWNKRPRQFRMQIYSKSDHKGEVQTLRATNGDSPPCWNLSSRKVGSFEMNDPLVKVKFYRSSDCKGAASETFSFGSSSHDHVLIKAKSVSITKVKPVLPKDQHAL